MHRIAIFDQKYDMMIKYYLEEVELVVIQDAVVVQVGHFKDSS